MMQRKSDEQNVHNGPLTVNHATVPTSPPVDNPGTSALIFPHSRFRIRYPRPGAIRITSRNSRDLPI